MAAKIKFKQIRGIIRGKKKATKKKVIVCYRKYTSEGPVHLLQLK